MPTEPTPTAAGKTTPKAPKPTPEPAPKKPAPKTPQSAPPAGGVTMSKFATDVLTGLGLPVTSENIRAFQAWAQAEGGSAAFNPLNTTQGASGASNYNHVGVKNYTSYQQGVQATIQTLQNGRYTPILNALHGGNNAMTVAQAVAATPWGTGTGVVRVLGGTVSDRTISGSGAGNGGSAADGSAILPAHATSQQVKDKVAQQYGYLSGFLDNPEIGPILQQAAKEGWDSSRLEGAIYATNWYKTHAAVTRSFDSQTKLDPATQSRQIMSQADDIMAQAKRAGIVLDHTALSKLAWTSLRYGWSGQQLTNAIVAQGKMDLSGKTPNGALTTADNLKEAAAQYMVPVSQQSLLQWTKQIQAGQMSVQDFNGYLKEQAKSLFPGLSGAIDRGVTVEQYADPYRQQAAQTLEVDPQSIDFMHDPKYQKALYQIDPKTKDRTAMSLADWGTYLRGLPEFAKTAQANQQAAGMATSILNVFGKVAS